MGNTEETTPVSPNSTTLSTQDQDKHSTPSSTSTTATDTPSSSLSSTTDPANQARERRIASLKSHVASFEKQLKDVLAKQEEVNSKLKDPTNPEATVKRHIKLLHEFNEIRDVAQGLIGLIAESRGVRVQDVYPEFGLDSDD